MRSGDLTNQADEASQTQVKMVWLAVDGYKVANTSCFENFGDSEIWANLEVKQAKIYSLQPIKQMLHKISCTHLLSVKSTLFKGTSHLLTFRFKVKFSIFSHFIPKNQLKSGQLIWNLTVLPQFFHGSPPTFTLNLHPTPPSARGATTPAAARQCRRRRWRRRSAPQQGRQGQRRPAARSPGAAALYVFWIK